MAKPGPKPDYGEKATQQLNITLPPTFMDLILKTAEDAGYIGKGSAVAWARDVLLEAVTKHQMTVSTAGAADPNEPKT